MSVAEMGVVDEMRATVIFHDAEDGECVQELEAMVMGWRWEEVVMRGFVDEVFEGAEPGCDDEGGDNVCDCWG